MNESNQKKPSTAGVIAEEIIKASAEPNLESLMTALEDTSKTTSTKAARIVEEIAARKPDLMVSYIEKLINLLSSDQSRVVQTCANALPHIARIAPAKVAKHLDLLTNTFDSLSEIGKDGAVRTFVALCNASIAYQKRLIDVLERALSGADGKTLQRWTDLILPVLKGEPHAQARAEVERRLNDIPRPIAKKIAESLGIHLRPLRT
ncbi:MAG: hypothetical protein JXA30_10735 [Deltaproteobacteria bacterium]|nr:hypothetical protein [Deltaproteobacteria bacterium]